ncbi:flagellar biosynthesis anti-sigma factor FlgM [Methylibium sp. Pch-M]|jgi:negative regulator of flagellin synthesis FlgM|uniref:Negative regulator of flagellin synthesis n=1 Tax=Methylibium petroleiphilum (strain ATCC BAA-1232 / LMG 22953 / PM1) TaxID=420662 RepID=A2SKD9_METPP|nr:MULTISPECIES: flagellar biosynthesis anti-sigma factor FlgM [Methylibium]ABM96028.1 Negative regulator of flagellin synthesis (anti-s28 factor) [Methylibium petroleiphilum PM1]EWS54751.1 anti-sigma28 factor FlgM [Methylibium sp. T29]EWS61411.1 anti-sigma28 factor FlgM [Methylibium sp. T29-B]MBN9204686.1 flagellar biosynthesis anti-sigma factor FlgM [Methylibium petroleiphilum]QAZ38837.1 flagellar biosynthesis anti-sigma factor FlgM [Methylibium sp. Pch-M]
MKIGQTSTPAADAAILARSNAEAGAAAAKARVAQAADAGTSTVELSSTATALLAGASSPEFDAAKVERMKQAIADGSFKVNADVIADKLIANAQEMLDAVKR